MKMALRKVERNKGAAGIDGMTVKSLWPYLKEHWPSIKWQLLQGTYKPQQMTWNGKSQELTLFGSKVPELLCLKMFPQGYKLERNTTSGGIYEKNLPTEFFNIDGLSTVGI